MKNRKGELTLETVIKVVIAAIVLVFIFGFAGKLYGAFRGENKKDQAESTLKEFAGLLQNLEQREIKSSQFIFQNPDGWFVAFPFSLNREEFIPPPSACKENCICICEDKDCSMVLACEAVKYNVEDSSKLSAYFEIPRGGVDYNVEFFQSDKKYILTRK